MNIKSARLLLLIKSLRLRPIELSVASRLTLHSIDLVLLFQGGMLRGRRSVTDGQIVQMLLILKMTRRMQVELRNFFCDLVDYVPLRRSIVLAVRCWLLMLLVWSDRACSVTDGLYAGVAALVRLLGEPHVEILSIILLSSLIMVG